MAAKGYCTFEDIEGLLGQTLTAGQRAQCESLIEAAELEFDGETGRAWMTGAQTLEVHYVKSPNIFLKYAPVGSISAVKGRSALGEAETDLVADTDYEVRDLSTGLILLVTPNDYDRIRVTYTPVATVPADITRAIAEWVAARLMPSLTPGTYGLDSVTLPDYAVKFSRAHVQEMAPPNVRAVIDRYRYWVVG